MRRVVRCRRGSSALEFALLLPILLALTMPVLDLTWYFFIKQAVVESSQIGARAGATTWLTDGPAAKANSTTLAALAASLPPGANTPVVVTSVDTTGTNTVIVDISVPFTPLTGLISLPSNVQVVQKMRIEHL